ncbi:MAG: peptidyl-prolyl cis-trans isomerase [Alphaproteobacteria bacterium]|nr:peptidyl-prolyl cis-trans isomerase [Alphaproteobacteria bacterium]
MLESIRKSSNSTFFKAFLSILALSFVAWGASDFFTGRNNATAIEVNGEGISIYDVDKAFRDRVQALSKQYGRNIEPELISAAGIDMQVLENIITDNLIFNAANDLGLRISNKHVQTNIVNSGAFNDDSGSFSPTVYKNLVRAQGYTTEAFENQMRRDLTKSIMGGAFLSLPVSEQTAAQLAKTALENLDLQVFHVNRADIKNVTVPTETEQRAYYERYTAAFIVPETRSANILSVSYDMLTEGMEVSEDSIKAYYETHGSEFSTEETRKARHILVSDMVEAERLYQELKNGADFATLASEHSNDPISKSKGGDLGFFAKDDMVSEFADSAFTLEVGTVSTPVESPFGYHIIEVTEVKESSIPALQDIREDIQTVLAEDMAAEKFDRILGDIDSMILEGQTVASIASALELPIETVKDITEKDTTLADDVRTEIFKLSNGDVSDPITNDTLISVVHVTGVTPSRTKTFAESQIDIIKTLQEEGRTEKLLLTTNTALKDLKAGKSFSQVERELKLTKPLDSVYGVTRSQKNAPKWIGAAALSNLFALDTNEFYQAPIATPNGYALVRIAKKNTPNPTSSQVEAMQKQLSASLRQDLEFQYIVKKRAEAQVKANGPLLRQVFGSNFNPNAL